MDWLNCSPFPENTHILVVMWGLNPCHFMFKMYANVGIILSLAKCANGNCMWGVVLTYLDVVTYKYISELGLRWLRQWHFEGILPKGPYLPCVSMAGRALLAGYPRFVTFTPPPPNHCLNEKWIIMNISLWYFNPQKFFIQAKAFEYFICRMWPTFVFLNMPKI